MNDQDFIAKRFPDLNSSFVFGIQVGVIWERLKLLPPGDTLVEMIDPEIRSVLDEIARHERCVPTFQPAATPYWIEATYTKLPAFIPKIV